MRHKLALALVLIGAVSLAGCSAADNTNTRANSNTVNSSAGNPPREGVVEANANIPANANSQSVSANTAVLTNDNGNANTAAVRTINGNKNANSNKNRN